MQCFLNNYNTFDLPCQFDYGKMPSPKNFSRNRFVTIDKFSERVYNCSMKFSGCFVQYCRCRLSDKLCNQKGRWSNEEFLETSGQCRRLWYLPQTRCSLRSVRI